MGMSLLKVLVSGLNTTVFSQHAYNTASFMLSADVVNPGGVLLVLIVAGAKRANRRAPLAGGIGDSDTILHLGLLLYLSLLMWRMSVAVGSNGKRWRFLLQHWSKIM